MRPVAQGRPGTEVIPAGWSAAHQPVLDKTHGATVSLRRPGGTKGDFDRDTGKWEITPNAAYLEDQAARVQVMPTQDQETVTGGQSVTTLAYAVQLNADVAITEDNGVRLKDVLTVTAVDDNGDPELVGTEMVVASFESGSLHWERRIVCIRDLETQGT